MRDERHPGLSGDVQDMLDHPRQLLCCLRRAPVWWVVMRWTREAGWPVRATITREIKTPDIEAAFLQVVQPGTPVEAVGNRKG